MGILLCPKGEAHYIDTSCRSEMYVILFALKLNLPVLEKICFFTAAVEDREKKVPRQDRES